MCNFLGSELNFNTLYSRSSLAERAAEIGISISLLEEFVKGGGSENPKLSLNDSLFDATEELDTYSSIEVLRQSN